MLFFHVQEEENLLLELQTAYDRKNIDEVKVIAEKHHGRISILRTRLKPINIRALVFAMDSAEITQLQ